MAAENGFAFSLHLFTESVSRILYEQFTFYDIF